MEDTLKLLSDNKRRLIITPREDKVRITVVDRLTNLSSSLLTSIKDLDQTDLYNLVIRLETTLKNKP